MITGHLIFLSMINKVTDVKADKRGTQAKKKVEDVKKSSSFVDPLSSLGPLASSFEGSDPLSKIASEGIDQAPRSTRTKVCF